MAITIVLTLGLGVEIGVTAGVVTSVLVHLYKTSRPHMAVVGQVPGTEHCRNLLRHEVLTDPMMLVLSLDENLNFPVARYLEDKLHEIVASRPEVTDVVLMGPAVDAIDPSAFESLEAMNTRLPAGGVRFHLSEVKDPVMDKLERSHFLAQLTGEVFLGRHDAMRALSSGPTLNPVGHVPLRG